MNGKLSVLMMLLLAVVITSVGNGQEPEKKDPAKVTWSDGDKARVEEPAGAAKRRTLSIVEARRLGLTFPAIRKCCEELKASGDIDKNTSRAEVAALVAERISVQNAAAWGDPKAVDWDAILSFIDRLLPLILKLIDLFSMQAPPFDTLLVLQA